MAVMNAQYKHPQSACSQGFKNSIDTTLKANPADRPNIHQLIEMIERVLRSLSWTRGGFELGVFFLLPQRGLVWVEARIYPYI